jgi:RimJ/RimL family protein N-acetyltransferase
MKEKFRQVPSTVQHLEVPFTPFLLLTANLVLVPTPLAISIPAYRALYANVHADPLFCEMGFGHHFRARIWSDEETRDVILTRDVARSWKERGIGDFAIGLRGKGDGESTLENDVARKLGDEGREIRIVDGDGYERLVGKNTHFFDALEWVAYAGIRDATTTSMPERVPSNPELPPWQEMVEVRYGVVPEHWGKGIAKTTVDTVMQWAVCEREVKRFIAETERENARSGRVLEKMGFKLSGTNYVSKFTVQSFTRFNSTRKFQEHILLSLQ